MLENLGKFVGHVGLPGAALLFLLWIVNGTLQEVATSNHQLAMAIIELKSQSLQMTEILREMRSTKHDILVDPLPMAPSSSPKGFNKSHVLQ